MKGLRVLFVALALWLAVGVPGFVAWENREAAVAEAAGPIATALSLACLGMDPFLCALVTAGTIMVVYEAYSTGVTIPSSPEELVQLVSDWINSDVGGAHEFRLQFSAHPNYIDVTQSMVSELMAAIWGLETNGWTVTPDWEGLGTTVWSRSWPSEEQVIAVSGFTTMPMVSNCTSLVWEPLNKPQGPGGSPDYTELDWVPEGEGGNSSFWSKGDLTGSYYYSSPHLAVFNGALVFQSQAADYGCETIGEKGQFQLRMPPGMGVSAAGALYYLPEVMHMCYHRSGYSPTCLTLSMTDFTAFAYAGALVANTRVRMPTDVNSVDTPADGPAVTPTPGESQPEDVWDRLGGLFGGVTRPLDAIKEFCKTIASDVAEVRSLVTDIPTTMVNALAAAVVPDTGQMESDSGDLSEQLKVRFPFSLLIAAYAIMPNMFQNGSSCLDFDWGTGSVSGWPAETSHVCVDAGAAAICYNISTVLAAFLALMYGITAAREVMGIQGHWVDVGG